MAAPAGSTARGHTDQTERAAGRGKADLVPDTEDADGDLGAGGAELLEEAAVRADPQVALGDFHLQGRSPESAGARGSTQSLPATESGAGAHPPTRDSPAHPSPARLGALTAQRYPEPGVVSRPSSSRVMVIM